MDVCLSNAFASVHAAPDDEPLLPKYFVDTNAVQQISASAERVLFVGSKGSGKTAAFRRFTEFGQKPDIAVGISPGTHELAMPRVDVSSGACSRELQYEIVLELLRKYSDVRKRSRAAKKARNHIEKFTTALKGAGGRLRGVSILGNGISLADPTSRTVAGLVGRGEVQEARETLQAICRDGNDVRLAIDDPEDVFSASATLDVNLMGGLFLAIGSLSQLSPRLQVISFVKSHVFEATRRHVADLDHYYPHKLGKLWWDEPSFIALLTERVNAFCGAKSWPKALFGSKISDRKLRKYWDYILPRLLTGARDLIKWTQLAVAFAAGQSRSYVSIEDYKAVEHTFSEEVLSTLCVAESTNYPGLEHVLQRAFATVPTSSFRGVGELSQHFEHLYSSDEDFGRLFQHFDWLATEDSSTLPGKLLRVGVLGLRVGDETLLPYSQNYSDDALQQSTEVFLAPALGSAIDSRSRQPYGRRPPRGRKRK